MPLTTAEICELGVERMRTGSEKMRMGPKTFIWLQTGFIGDIVLATGAIDLVKQHFPDASQHFITTQAGAAILNGHRHLSSISVFDKRSDSTLAAFRRVKKSLQHAMSDGRSSPIVRSNSVLLQLHRSHRSSLLSLYLGFPRIVFHEAAFTWGALAKVSQIAVFPEAQRQAMLLEPLGVSRQQIMAATTRLQPRADDLPQEWTQWIGLRQNRGVVGIAPGSIWGTKRWPRQGFVEVVLWLLRETTFQVVLLGSQNEVELCDSILARVAAGMEKTSVASPRVLSLAGRTTLTQLLGLYPNFAALVANDSSAVHFASAFQVPTVAVYGATIPQMGFAPTAPRSISIGKALECRPCSDHGPQVCPLGHFRCMKELASELVIGALRGILFSQG